MRNSYKKIFLIGSALFVAIWVSFQLIKDSLIFGSDDSCENSAKMIKMSKLLNEAMHKVGRLTCEKSSIDVSENGGWCFNISGRNSIEHVTDEKLATGLSTFLRGKTVASFGDGPGVYKELILKMNKVKSYDAYDGAPYAVETTENRVQFLDLSVPIYHLPKYDWVISLEVAEHIPGEFEGIFVDNVLRHAKEGVVLSWSKEGQIGHSHVNNRNFDYVKKIVEAKGFMHSEKLTEYIKEKASLPHLKSNINIFLRVNYLNLNF